MCETCGCGEKNGYTVNDPKKQHHSHFGSGHEPVDHHHEEGHQHTHSHENHHSRSEGRTIRIEQDVLHKNNLLAERNRGYFEAKNIIAVNLVSSPGSGKTTLLEKTIKELNDLEVSVIEGDQQTSIDAERILSTGAQVLQINTGNGCHLDAGMIHNAVKELTPAENSLLVIENVGNLVCPALFDLGEKFRVLIISITEGEDKPLKYPYMFASSHLCLINKADLLPYLSFDMDRLKKNALQVNPRLEFIELSALTGKGLEKWIKWLKSRFKKS